MSFFTLLFLLFSSVKVSKCQATPRKYSLSGFSSGGCFVMDHSFAYSRDILGVGIVSGGPYLCGDERSNNCSVEAIIQATNSFAQEGLIDPTEYIGNQRVFLYSGTLDTIVLPMYTQKCYELYKYYGSTTLYQSNLSSEHAMITDFYGNECNEFLYPYINDCNYDLSGVILQYIYNNNLRPKANSYPFNNLIEIDQTQFFPEGMSSEDISLGSTAFIYIPTGCSIHPAPIFCRIHVVYHGCNQYMNNLTDTYARNTGYNFWAESNYIIVLYPQTRRDILKKNIEGCWDWTGYESENYAYKSAPQIVTVVNMVNYVMSS